LLKREVFPHRFTPLVSISHLLWHEGCGIIQAAISEAAGGLRDFPCAPLDTQSKLKEPLNIVGVPIGSYRLEKQVPGRRGIAHLLQLAVDHRDADLVRWRGCPFLLQGFFVLPPGRIQILLVDGIAERREHLRWRGVRAGNGVGEGEGIGVGDGEGTGVGESPP